MIKNFVKSVDLLVDRHKHELYDDIFYNFHGFVLNDSTVNR